MLVTGLHYVKIFQKFAKVRIALVTLIAKCIVIALPFLLLITMHETTIRYALCEVMFLMLFQI